MRLVRYIKNKYPWLSNTTIREAIAAGDVLLGKRTARLVDEVDESMSLVLAPHLLVTSLSSNEKINCQLLSIDDDFVFFEKGAGIPSVAQRYSETDTAANWLLSIDPNLQQVGSALESGLLNRLDTATSGVMVAARHQSVYHEGRKIFSGSHRAQIEKIYKAVSKWAPPVGVHTAFVDSLSNDKPRVFLTEEERPEEVVTEIIDVTPMRLGYESTIRLVTGFRHQIRAHLSFLGAPLLGDLIYGGSEANRLYLHAFSLKFEYPSSVKRYAKSLQPW